jgi:plasmid stability protein
VATLTIPDIDDGTYRRLADWAELNGRSLEEEARKLLDREFPPRISREEAIREADAIRRSLEGKFTGDTTAWIREDRDSR